MMHLFKHEGVIYKRYSIRHASQKLAKNPSLKWFLVGSNINEFHFFSGWNLAYISSDGAREAGILQLAKEFGYYLEPELGRSIAYVEVTK